MKKRNRFLAVLFLSTALVVGGCGLGDTSSASTTVVSSDSATSGSESSAESNTISNDKNQEKTGENSDANA